MTTKDRYWSLDHISTDESDPEMDMAVFGMRDHSTGRVFVVSLSAPKKVSATEYLSALRAAAAFYQQAAGLGLPNEFIEAPSGRLN